MVALSAGGGESGLGLAVNFQFQMDREINEGNKKNIYYNDIMNYCS